MVAMKSPASGNVINNALAHCLLHQFFSGYISKNKVVIRRRLRDCALKQPTRGCFHKDSKQTNHHLKIGPIPVGWSMSLFARLSDGRERWSYSRREPAKQTVSQAIQTRTPATTAIDSKTIPHRSPVVNAKTPYAASSPTTIAIAINRTGNESDVRWRNRHANATKPMLEMAAKMAAATAMTIIRPGGAIERL